MLNSNKIEGWQEFIKILIQTKPPKLVLSVAIIISLISTIVSLILPLFFMNVIDNFSIMATNWSTIIVLVTLFIFQAIASGISLYFLTYAGQKVVANLRLRLWKKLLYLPIEYYDRNKSGEMVSQLVNDTLVIKGILTNNLTEFVTGLILTIGTIIILFILNWKMTLIVILSILFAFVILVPLGRKIYKISMGYQNEIAKLTALVSQGLSEIRLVKSSNMESVEYTTGEKAINNLFKYSVSEGKLIAIISPIMSFTNMLFIIVIISYGSLQLSAGTISSGELVAFVLYLFQLMRPLNQFTLFFTQLQRARGATERIAVTLDYSEENYKKGKVLKNISEDIIFNNISFEYEKEQPVLKKISLTACYGEVTAFVGPSGSGKTTLFSLLERFYSPVNGVIKIGANNINDFSLESWRSKIGYVSQETPIVSGTIKDNILYGVNRDVDEKELIRVAKMAYAHEFIDGFKEKYNTQVGDRGIKLSGGQRQRIGIARVLLRDPKILLLDEATSNLDTKSEEIVQYALNNLMKDRTTLIIAHRLSTIVNADKIVVVENGEITGTGTHWELLKNHCLYKELASQQLLVPEQIL
ncbi:MAG TPA: multidrug ABC transporter permease [Bacillus sp. (in: Bacteria)]|nr:multidrug ABC transporter permease [Bacillus sp. (in: firmicutes)]